MATRNTATRQTASRNGSNRILADASRAGQAPGAYRAIVVGLGWILASALPATAQYTPPGTVTPVAGIPSKETLEKAIMEAPWALGPVKVSPWLGLRDAQLVSNRRSIAGDEEGEDFTATAGAGLRAYLEPGSKVVVAAQALPEYVWWQESARKRRLNGRYGVGAFGYFNRLTMEVSGRHDERQGFFSNEVQELTTNRQQLFRLALALRLGSRIELFIDGQRSEVENVDGDDPIFARLDREDRTATAGVRYRAPGGLTFELSVQDRNLEFARDARDLSSSGTSEGLAISYRGTPLELRLALTGHTLEPEPGSRFRGFDDLTGSLDVLWNAAGRWRALAYARRDFRFSLLENTSHFVGDRLGARFDLEVGPGTFGVYGEVGEDDFEPIHGSPERLDDVASAGIDLRFRLRELMILSVYVERTEYDSNLDGFDRDVRTVGFAFELGQILQRLSLGATGGEW